MQTFPSKISDICCRTTHAQRFILIKSEDFIDGLYQVLLRRAADAAGRLDKIRRIESGTTNIPDMLNEFIHSEEFKSNMQVLLSDMLGNKMPFTNNVSQFDEIGLLIKSMVNDSVAQRVVIDVGARGKERSNSWDLMTHFGWKGVLVEANKKLLSQIEDQFLGLDYSLVNCAVSDYTGTATFNLGMNDDVSSLNIDAAKSWGEIRGEMEVQVRRLGDILIEKRVPLEFGLLSLDIEGEDIKVLNDLIDSSEYRPIYIIIEASYDFKTKSLTDLPMIEEIRKSYEIIGSTRANLLLKKR